MTKRTQFTERGIAIMQILIGLFAFVFAYQVISSMYGLLNENQMLVTRRNYLTFFFKYHLFIIVPFLLLFSGWKLFKSRKTGWLLSIILLIYITISLAATNLTFKKNDFTWRDSTLLILFQVLFLLMTVLILLKPFRERYRPTKIDWFVIGTSVSFLLLDRLVLT